MKKENIKMKKTIEELNTATRMTKDPPVSFHCAFTETGGLDISSGRYTAGYPGTYTVTYSLTNDVYQGSGNYIQMYVRKNGQNLPESYHQSIYNIDSTGYMYEQGGRTLITHLARGDYIELYCIDCNYYIRDTLFCVSLSQFDV